MRTTESILARREEITNAEWLELLEERMNKLKGSIRKMTLPSLGTLQPVYCQYQCQHLRDVKEVSYTGSKILNMETRGIFPGDREGYIFSNQTENEPVSPGLSKRIGRFWGLTRDYDWFTVEVLVQIKKKERGCYTSAEKVFLADSSLQEVCDFCNVHPAWIWHRLGTITENWANERKKLYEEAENVALQIRMENFMAKAYEELPRSVS